MSIFDNAEAVSVGGRSVSKLKLDGATIWSKKQSATWDLPKRRWVTPTADYVISESSPFVQLDEGIYITLVFNNGINLYHSGNSQRVSQITDSGFVLNNGGAGTGVGVPYRVKAGEVIRLSLRKDANCQIIAVYYGEDKTYSSKVVMGNTGTELSLSDTAPINGWVVLHFCPYNANQTVTFSDLSLSIS